MANATDYVSGIWTTPLTTPQYMGYVTDCVPGTVNDPTVGI
jgi:hypothetical protein